MTSSNLAYNMTYHAGVVAPPDINLTHGACNLSSCYHDLGCGHRVKTPYPENCGTNCKTPTLGSYIGSEFACEACIVASVRLAMDVEEMNMQLNEDESEVDPVERAMHIFLCVQEEMEKLKESNLRIYSVVERLEPLLQFHSEMAAAQEDEGFLAAPKSTSCRKRPVSSTPAGRRRHAAKQREAGDRHQKKNADVDELMEHLGDTRVSLDEDEVVKAVREVLAGLVLEQQSNKE